METKLENKLSSIKKNKNFYEHNDSCSTCKQTIAENFKIQEIKKLTTKEKQLIKNERPWGLILFNRNIKSILQLKKLTQEKLKLKVNAEKNFMLRSSLSVKS